MSPSGRLRLVLEDADYPFGVLRIRGQFIPERPPPHAVVFPREESHRLPGLGRSFTAHGQRFWVYFRDHSGCVFAIPE